MLTGRAQIRCGKPYMAVVVSVVWSGIPMTPEQRLVKRVLATRFVDRVNRNTSCARCGGGPIEWHHEDHPEFPNRRVSSLRAQGASLRRIVREMRVCTPLCRTCHMTVDGRLDALRLSGPYTKGQTYVGLLPCKCCGREYKPLRRGLCSSCYNHKTGLRKRVQPGCCAEWKESKNG